MPLTKSMPAMAKAGPSHPIHLRSWNQISQFQLVKARALLSLESHKVIAMSFTQKGCFLSLTQGRKETPLCKRQTRIILTPPLPRQLLFSNDVMNVSRQNVEFFCPIRGLLRKLTKNDSSYSNQSILTLVYLSDFRYRRTGD